MNKEAKDFSELLALEKAGRYQDALERIQSMAITDQGEPAASSLNLKLLEQRLRSRLKTSPSHKSETTSSHHRIKPRLDNKKAPTWSAIITMWKRQDYLAEQITAIRAQSIPPEEIIIILNEGHIPETKIREIGGADIKIIRSDINSLYSRWAVAYIAKGEYVSVFDDDVIPGCYWIANAIRACSSYNALVGPAGRIYNKNGQHGYYKLVVPNASDQNSINCAETDVYCDWVCNSYLFKREWVGHALSLERYKDYFKTFDDIQLATSLYRSGGIRCITPMQPSFDKDLHGSLQHHYGNDAHAIWKTNSDQHFAGRKSYIEELIKEGYIPVQQRDNLFRFHLIVPFGERATLERCLLTVKGQDYKNFTCTLIDDCCDGKDAMELVKRLCLDNASFRYIKTIKKAYPLRAREIATDMLDANPADVIIHLDGDDWLPYPDVLSRINRIYRKGGALVTYGNALCIRNSQTDEFREFTQYDMSRKWNVAQRELDAKVFAFRKIQKEEILSGWRDAPWCGFHLRTFCYAKWLTLNRMSFKDSGGEYHKVGTDAAILVPILESSSYESIIFVPDLTYVYQNSMNTIHAKKEISARQKAESLKSIANSEVSINKYLIKKILIGSGASKPCSDAHVIHDGIKAEVSCLPYQRFDDKITGSGKSCAVTIVTPNYLADAIICLMSYQRNLNIDCQLFIFIATDSKEEVAACDVLLDGTGIIALFPGTLRYAKEQSQALSRKYKTETDEYRWAMKPVALLELLSDGYSLAVFLDPDTYTVSNITDIHKNLASHPISVFPHFRDPDNEYLRGVLYKDGFFNGGMLAATADGVVHLIRLYKRCLNELKKDPPRHRWDDQKYFDLFTLEVDNLFINLDRGINYNYWNYDPVDGLIAPSQRSLLLKSGCFARLWHVSTTLIRESISLKDKKFTVYRPIISMYLLSLICAINLMLVSAKSRGLHVGNDWLGLASRFNNITEKISQISGSIPLSESKDILKVAIDTDTINTDHILRNWLDSVVKSICFDNNELFARMLLCFFPNNVTALQCANTLREQDLQYIADEIVANPNYTPDQVLGNFQSISAGELIAKRLKALQSCKINY